MGLIYPKILSDKKHEVILQKGVENYDQNNIFDGEISLSN